MIALQGAAGASLKFSRIMSSSGSKTPKHSRPTPEPPPGARKSLTKRDRNLPGPSSEQSGQSDGPGAQAKALRVNPSPDPGSATGQAAPARSSGAGAPAARSSPRQADATAAVSSQPASRHGTPEAREPIGGKFRAKEGHPHEGATKSRSLGETKPAPPGARTQSIPPRAVTQSLSLERRLEQQPTSTMGRPRQQQERQGKLHHSDRHSNHSSSVEEGEVRRQGKMHHCDRRSASSSSLEEGEQR